MCITLLALQVLWIFVLGCGVWVSVSWRCVCVPPLHWVKWQKKVMSYLKVAATDPNIVPFKQVFICLKTKVFAWIRKQCINQCGICGVYLGSELPSYVSITDELEMKNSYSVNVCLIVWLLQHCVACRFGVLFGLVWFLWLVVWLVLWVFLLVVGWGIFFHFYHIPLG